MSIKSKKAIDPEGMSVFCIKMSFICLFVLESNYIFTTDK